MSAAMFASIKELKARVSALEERLEARGEAQPELTAEQHQSLEQKRQTLRLSLKKPAA